MRIFAIIPARYGSKRFNGKPLALIAGNPMIQHVYQRAAQSNEIHDVVVATDDQRIFNAVTKFGGRCVMTRSANRSGTDRVAEAAHLLDLAPDDIVINVQGDQPLLNPQCLDALIKPLKTGSEPCMSTLAFKIEHCEEFLSPKDVKVVFDRNERALYFSRAPIPANRDDDDGHTAYKHLGVYAYHRAFLDQFAAMPSGRLEQIEKLEQLRVLEQGGAIQVVITPYDSPEVDLPADIGRIEALLRIQ